MSDIFNTAADLAGYLFRIQDNGGDSADRYTVLFSDGDALSLSGSPSHPQGVSIWAEGMDPRTLEDWAEAGAAVDLGFFDLPERIRAHILGRVNEAWRDCLQNIEAGHVPTDRAAAFPNEGTHLCAAEGIYRDAAGRYFVHLDGDAEDDRGPFDTAAEALRASLPDIHGLAGPEYHSPVISDSDVGPDQPDAERLAAVAALEARVAAAWETEREESGYV